MLIEFAIADRTIKVSTTNGILSSDGTAIAGLRRPTPSRKKDSNSV